jgi:hypothetical protein
MKILTFDIPFDNKKVEEKISKYINEGYIIVDTQILPEYKIADIEFASQYFILLKQYSPTIFSGPYTFNIAGDI